MVLLFCCCVIISVVFVIFSMQETTYQNALSNFNARMERLHIIGTQAPNYYLTLIHTRRLEVKMPPEILHWWWIHNMGIRYAQATISVIALGVLLYKYNHN